jgi:hypothetical protein
MDRIDSIDRIDVNDFWVCLKKLEGQGRDGVENGRRMRGGWCFVAVATRPGRPCYGWGRSVAGGGIGDDEWTVLTGLTVLT